MAAAPLRNGPQDVTRSLEIFSVSRAPAEVVGGTCERSHPDAMIDRVSARVAGHDDMVSGLERLTTDALPIERAGRVWPGGSMKTG